MSTATLDAVFCRETFWRDQIRVSTNVVAELFLERGWRCTWLTSPVTLTRRWWRPGPHRRRLAMWRAGGHTTSDRVFEYAPAVPVTWSWRPVLRSAWLGRNALRLACPSLPRVLARQRLPERPRVLWIGSLPMASALAAIPAERTAYHAHDLFMDYPGAPPQLRAVERWVVERVDAVFATSAEIRDALVARYGAPHDKVHLLGHGVHLDRYGPAPEPPELIGIARPRAVLVGTLDEVDASLLARLMRHRPDLSVVCIGPGGAALRRLSPRLHLLGPRANEDVPPYLLHADVGLILYALGRDRDRRAGCNPMKLYEYAAAGLPVVTTWLPAYAGTGAPVLSGRTAEELDRGLDEALAAPAAHRRRMRAFAAGHGWDAKYDFICERLGL